MCLDLTDDDDDLLPKRPTMIQDANGKYLKDKREEEEELEDCFVENILVGLWNMVTDLFDIEKVLYCLFFY